MITFNHFNFNVLDLERSLRFYDEALGLKVRSVNDAADGRFRIVFLTDGVTESRNEAGEQFSVERVEAILQRSENAERFIERLKAALKEFCSAFDDDLTAVAFDL